MEATTSAPTAPTAEAPKAAKKAPAKKPAAKPAPKGKAQKAAGPALTKPQVRILAALAKAKNGYLSVDQIAEKAGVAKTWVVGFTFKACAANRTPSLAEQGLVNEHVIAEAGPRGERGAEIRAAGRKALEKAAG